MIDVKDYIVSYYNNSDKLIVDKPNSVSFKNKELSNITLYNLNGGVGDSLIFYLFKDGNQNKNNIKIYYNPNLGPEFKNLNVYIDSIRTTFIEDPSYWVCHLQSDFGLNGHFIQKIQKAFDLELQIKPHAYLYSEASVKKNKIVMTFDRGPVDQTHIHPRARTLYQESKHVIQEFINNNLNKYEFVEVGRIFSGLENVENKTNIGLKLAIDEIASCEYFFGIHNGLMHAAVGLNKKSIILVNFPDAKDIVLPNLKAINLPDIDWLYPQNVHLHQDNDAYLVPKLNYTNLEKAFNGEVYPFWREEYLDLILN
jgi:hypothetical protein